VAVQEGVSCARRDRGNGRNGWKADILSFRPVEDLETAFPYPVIMSDKRSSDELERALARVDADKMIQQLDAYADYFARGAGDWPDQHADDFGEIISCHFDDPEKAFAYVVIDASRSDDPRS
jgi:hypothetical protein